MIEWHKIEAGDYLSADNRFNIIRGYDRIHGNHWMLKDYKGDSITVWYKDSLKGCKFLAESVLNESS